MTFKDMDVSTLIALSQAGDREAFGELFERYRGAVINAGRLRERDGHELADLVQEVFLHAMQKIGQLRDPNCFAAWLRRITVRVAINRKTRRPPLPTLSGEFYDEGDGGSSNPLDELMRLERRDILRDAVADLRPIDRDALVAFYLKSKPLADIAREFDVPLGTIKRRLHVARHRLEASLRARLNQADLATVSGDEAQADQDADTCEVAGNASAPTSSLAGPKGSMKSAGKATKKSVGMKSAEAPLAHTSEDIDRYQADRLAEELALAV